MSTRALRHPASHPYTVLSSPDSPPLLGLRSGTWDSWFISVVLGQVELETDQRGRFGEYEEGTIRNFLDHTDEDGVMPVLPSLTDRSCTPTRAARRLLREHAQAGCSRSRRRCWLAVGAAPNGRATTCRHCQRLLERYLREPHPTPETGLAYWRTDFAIGVDNDLLGSTTWPVRTHRIHLPGFAARPRTAPHSASPLEDLDEVREANRWRGRAQDLADPPVNEHLWDERDGTFYSADLALRPIDPEDYAVPRRAALVVVGSPADRRPGRASCRCGPALHPLEQADRMRERVIDRCTFRANYGGARCRASRSSTTSRASNNPSNWLGPIWGVSNYLVFRGLLKYGFTDEARELAEDTVRLFGRDLETTGSLHEFYNPDNGEPIMTRNFQNWNFLVLNMIAWLEGRPLVVAEF